MAGDRTSVDAMADVIMEGLLEYADLASDTVKEAVTESAKTVKKEIQAGAPSRTGKYKKSWRTKKTKESSNGLVITVHSKDRSGTWPRQARGRQGGCHPPYRPGGIKGRGRTVG